MSVLLPCPHCGLRPVNEFRYGGEADALRPQPGDEDSVLAGRLYDAENPKGLAAEWWQHGVGCRSWFVLRRDTASDRVEPTS